MIFESGSPKLALMRYLVQTFPPNANHTNYQALVENPPDAVRPIAVRVSLYGWAYDAMLLYIGAAQRAAGGYAITPVRESSASPSAPFNVWGSASTQNGVPSGITTTAALTGLSGAIFNYSVITSLSDFVLVLLPGEALGLKTANLTTSIIAAHFDVSVLDVTEADATAVDPTRPVLAA